MYYTEELLREVISDEYEVIEFGRYMEMEPDDFLRHVVLKKASGGDTVTLRNRQCMLLRHVLFIPRKFRIS